MKGELHGVSGRRSRDGGVVETSSWFLVIFLLLFIFIFAELVCLGLQLVGLFVEFGSIAHGTMAIGLSCDLLVLHAWQYCIRFVVWHVRPNVRNKVI